MSQCVVNGINGQPFPINDNTTFDIKIDVTDTNHDDLSGIQGICGVRLNFEHTLISDLQIDIISPSDSSVTLIGPALRDITTPALLFPIGHDILFVPGSELAIPDPGTPSQWTNANPNWAMRPQYSGTYFPSSGDFEDAFASGPVDGTWTIRVSDNELNDQGILNSVEIIFCDDSGITCSVCEADGGSYIQSLELCEGDILSADLWEATSLSDVDDYGFIYLLYSEMDTLVIDQTFPFENLEDGSYSISALNVSVDDSLAVLNDLSSGIGADELDLDYCYSVSDTDLILDILPQDTLFTQLPFCDDSPTVFEGIAITNPDTTIIRPADGCAAFESISFIPSTVNADIEADTIIIPCNSAPVEIDGSNSNLGIAGEVSWTLNGFDFNNDGSTNIIVDFPGTYVLSINDFGCISQDSILAIFEFEVKEYEFFNTGPLTCNDTLATLGLVDQSAVFSANWTGPGIVSDSTFVGNIQVNRPGEYKVMGIDTSSCPYTRFLAVEENTGISSFEITSDTFSCDVDMVDWIFNSSSDIMTLNITQGSFSGSGTAIGTGSGSFIYSTSLYDTIYYSFTEANGCSLDSFYYIPTDTNFVSVQGGIDTLDCNTSLITLDPNASNSNANFEWAQNGTMISTDEVIDVTVPGSYQIVASLSNGCSDTALFDIMIDTISPLLSTFSDGDISCTKDSSLLQIEVTEGAEVDWKFPDVGDPMALSQVVFDANSYAVEVINPQTGCISQFTFDVSSTIQDPEFSIEKEDVSCTNSMGFFRISSDEEIIVTLVINGTDTIVTDQFEISDSARIAYLVTNENGCSVMGDDFIDNTITLPEFEVPSEIALDCIENTAVLRPNVVPSDLEDFYFVFETGDTLRVDSFIFDQPTVVEVVAIGLDQCVRKETVIVTESLFSGGFDFGIREGLYCNVSQLEVDMSLASMDDQIDYEWLVTGPTASIFELDNSVILSGEGEFILELTDNQNACSIADTFYLSFTDNPIQPFSFMTMDESCSGRSDGSIIIDPLTGGVGMLSTTLNGESIDMLIVDSLNFGTYSLSIADEFGCSRDTSFNIGVGGELSFELGEDRVVFPREEISLDPTINSDSEILTYTWIYNGDTVSTSEDISFIPPGEGVLSLTVLNEDGCLASDIINVTRALALEDLVYIPNAISVSSNIGNAVLLGSFSERISGVTSFSVFDRWGNLIHSLSNFLPGQNLLLWDGKMGNKHVASGVYVYYLEVVLENGQTERSAGDITVMN